MRIPWPASNMLSQSCTMSGWSRWTICGSYLASLWTECVTHHNRIAAASESVLQGAMSTIIWAAAYSLITAPIATNMTLQFRQVVSIKPAHTCRYRGNSVLGRLAPAYSRIPLTQRTRHKQIQIEGRPAYLRVTYCKDEQQVTGSIIL